mmetsp:Transcript_4878/g.6687  ORF Transcript_4878/g.6687 Transcript_4878/m.6687 type:complete len:193 (-) Transcript_4878:428-1006(-)
MMCKVSSLVSFVLYLQSSLLASAFSQASTPKNIYGIPDSGWSSPKWNWGSPFGTGHDCAMICRSRYDTPAKREVLVDTLINADPKDGDNLDFEEVKLVLGLAWQKARKTGLEAYGQVLDEMAKAERYEIGDEEACSRRFVHDMQKRYMWLDPEVEDKIAMSTLWYETTDYDTGRRRCSGLILKSMGFIEDGL